MSISISIHPVTQSILWTIVWHEMSKIKFRLKSDMRTKFSHFSQFITDISHDDKTTNGIKVYISNDIHATRLKNAEKYRPSNHNSQLYCFIRPCFMSENQVVNKHFSPWQFKINMKAVLTRVERLAWLAFCRLDKTGLHCIRLWRFHQSNFRKCLSGDDCIFYRRYHVYMSQSNWIKMIWDRWIVFTYNSYVSFVAYMLTYWGRMKFAAISEATLSNAFSGIKMYQLCLGFHWSILKFRINNILALVQRMAWH